MLCIVCGTNEEYEKGVCKECILDKVSLSVTGTLDITECPKCGSLKIGKKWYPDRQEQMLSKKAGLMVDISNPSFHKSFGKEDVRIAHDGTFTSLNLRVQREGFDDIQQTVSIPTRRLRNSCPTCNKITGSYYEAILQLRTVESRHEDILDLIKDEAVSIMQNLNRKDPESFISSVRKVPEGLDLFLGKRADGTRLSKHILDNYLGTMKVSKTLAGVRDGTKFYRFTYGVRIAQLETGAVISLGGKQYMIRNCSALGLDVIDTENNRTTKISKSTLFSSDYRIISRSPEKRTFIVLSEDNGEMQLMDKKTFDIITFRGKAGKEEVELVNFDGRYFLPSTA